MASGGTGRSGSSTRSSGRGGKPSGKPSGKSSGKSSGQPSGKNGQRNRQGGANRGANPVGRARKPAIKQRQVPWLLIGAIAVVVVLAVGVIGFALLRSNEVSAWKPSDDNRDPSLAIPGIVTAQYQGQQHVSAQQRVAYDRNPPFGGPHDQAWAACNGVVYQTAVRNENMVHSLEHGAVWIAYNPDQISGPALQALSARVDGQGYTMMSPYPGLDQPIALMSWGHELKLSDPNDPRIDQFISSLRQNQYTYPEVGASCDGLPGYFDQDNPPPFETTPPPPDAVTMDGRGAASNASGG